MPMLLAVGEEFPGKVPEAPQGGGVFEIMEDGTLFLTIQYPKPDAAEVAALKEGFSSYSLYVSPDPPYAAVWIWKFPAPVGYMETPFHAAIYQDLRMQHQYLTKAPEVNNAMTTVVLDGKIIVMLRMSGLRHDSLAFFHDVVWRQLVEAPLSLVEYDKALKRIYNGHTSRDLYQRGKQWKHREEK